MKRFFEWALIACLIGVLIYLGHSQFHLKHLRIFLFTLIPMVFFVVASFRWMHPRR
jgi:hypothetical protein